MYNSVLLPSDGNRCSLLRSRPSRRKAVDDVARVVVVRGRGGGNRLVGVTALSLPVSPSCAAARIGSVRSLPCRGANFCIDSEDGTLDPTPTESWEKHPEFSINSAIHPLNGLCEAYENPQGKIDTLWLSETINSRERGPYGLLWISVPGVAWGFAFVGLRCRQRLLSAQHRKPRSLIVCKVPVKAYFSS